MLKFFGILILTVGLTGICGGRDVNSANIARIPLQARSATATFGIEIYRDTTSSILFDLRIFCTDKCSSSTSYFEKIETTGLLGVFSLGDQYVTVWGVGDGMFVRVYAVSDDSIRTVLKTASRAMWPTITHLRDQRVICVGEATAGELLDSPPAKTQAPCPAGGKAWFWDGRNYHLSTTTR